MKKILAIMTMLVMMICMAVPVMAEEEETPSVTSDDLVIVISESDETPSEADMEGYELIGKVLDATLVHSETEEEATEEEVAAYIKAQGGSIVVDFSEYVKETPDKVLHKIDGSWKSESFSGAKVTVSSLSPFAFLKKTGNNPGAGEQGGKTSPQTGYNTTLWVVLGVMMVAGAGFCVAKARKNAA